MIRSAHTCALYVTVCMVVLAACVEEDNVEVTAWRYVDDGSLRHPGMRR